MTDGPTERVLDELELTRGLTIQMTALGTLGMVVAWTAFAGGAVAAVGLLLLVALAGPIVLGALGVDSLTVGTPGRLTFLFAFVNTPEELSISIGPAVLSVGAFVGLAYAITRSYRRGRASAAEAL